MLSIELYWLQVVPIDNVNNINCYTMAQQLYLVQGQLVGTTVVKSCIITLRDNNTMVYDIKIIAVYKQHRISRYVHAGIGN